MSRSSSALDAAIALHRGDRFAEAQVLYGQILAADPGNAEAWHLSGLAARQQKDLATAVERLARAIQLDPAQARYHFQLGEAYWAARKTVEAEQAYQQAARLQPEDARFHDALGVALASNGKAEEAIASHRRAVEVRSDFLPAHCNLARIFHAQGRLDEAISSYRLALQLNPSIALVYNNLGNALREHGRAEEAIDSYQHALRIDPSLAPTHLNLGMVLQAQGRFEEAAACYARAVRIDPLYVEALCNLGNMLKNLGRVGEAAACYERAIVAKPDCVEAHFNLGMSRLMLGDFVGGWGEFEWRWQLSGQTRRYLDRPLWDGSPLRGRTLLVYGEQGLGDTIQFCRYARSLAASGERILLDISPALVPLLSQSGFADLIVRDADLRFDVQIPLMSLPRVLGVTPQTVLADIPYLSADPRLFESWREVLVGGGFKVGIVWQGSTTAAGDLVRSVPLEQFAPLAQRGVDLISLQKGFGTEQLAALGAKFFVRDLGDRLDQSHGPFMDTAAIMRCLDLVVTCDTSIAHLAGALGVPVWLALSRPADWRWLLERDDSPWYPTMRLFRQTRRGDWSEVFAQMAEQLRNVASTSR